MFSSNRNKIILNVTTISYLHIVQLTIETMSYHYLSCIMNVFQSKRDVISFKYDLYKENGMKK